MSFPKYKEYAPLIATAGCDFPSHWSAMKLNTLAAKEEYAFADGPFGSNLKNEEYTNEGVPLIQLNNIGVGAHSLASLVYVSEEKANELIKHNIFPGDLVIAKMAEPVARASIVLGDFPRYVIVADCIRFKVNCELIDNKFAEYAINSSYFRTSAELVSRGTGRVRINLSSLKSLKVAVPELNEQLAIVDFLDRETVKIDALIGEQERLIELLQEKRQAVISHAVTKGLNPNAAMKDSGVEWLGEVPEHWDVTPLNYVLDAVGDVDHYMPPSMPEGVPYVMTGDLQDLASQINFENCKQIANQDYERLCRKIKTSRGDLIMARYATIGTVAYVDVQREFAVSYSCVTIKTDASKVSGKYLFFYLKSDAFAQGIRQRVNANTQDNVGIGDLKRVNIAMPPLNEQQGIINHLQLQASEIDKAIGISKETVRLLQERRSALISAAVTGQIDVRGLAQETAA